MASSRTYLSNLQGFPALFFLETMHDTRGDKPHMERMWSLEARYSELLAWLPQKYAKNDATKREYDTDIKPALQELKEEVDKMFDAYDGIFEGSTCNAQEKTFLKVMRGVRERIDRIAGMAGMIDNLGADDEEMMV